MHHPSPLRSLRQATGQLGHAVSWLATVGLVASVRAYQLVLSPWLGGHCRFTPSCSAYFIEAVRKYGPWRGAWRGMARILRCHPFHPGGHDPP